MSRSRGVRNDRSVRPAIQAWHEEYALSDSSPSGLRYRVLGSVSVVAGCPRENTWPHDVSMAHHCIWPRNYALSVTVDWEGTDLGGFIKWEPIVETVPAWTVREILLEHAQREQQIQLLEQHLGAA